MENEFPRDFKGIWIPKEIWLDENLNALDKVIFCEIDSLSCNENDCFASNEYLAKFCQCSESKITKSISKLIDLNYIFVSNFDGRHRHLRSRVVKNTSQPSKIYEADSEKMLAININNNIDNNNYLSYFKELINKEDLGTFKRKMKFLHDIQENENYDKLTPDEEYELRTYVLGRK